MSRDYNSSKNQSIKAKFVEREVYCNVNSMVEYILSKGYEDPNAPFTMDDVENIYTDNSEEIDKANEEREKEIEENQELFDNEEISEFTYDLNEEQINNKYDEQIEELEREQEEPNEVYEWWMVSNWLCDKLKEKGKVVLSDENIWGRCTTGQAILLDHVISEICEDLQILEGQKYEWDI